MQSNIFIVSATYLFKSFYRISFCKKNPVLPEDGSWLFFSLPGRWIGNEQLFKVSLIMFLIYILIQALSM